MKVLFLYPTYKQKNFFTAYSLLSSLRRLSITLMMAALLLPLCLFSQIAAPEIEWQHSFGGSDVEELYSIQQTTDGGYILGGIVNYGVHDYLVIKIDALGNEEWQQSYGGLSDDELYSIQQTTDGGYILGGYAYSGISGTKTSPNYGSQDYWVIKIDALGNEEWQQSFGGSSNDILYSIQQTTDGGYILGGYAHSGISGTKTSPNYGNEDYWVVKIDALGNQEWDQSFGGSSNDVLYSIQQTTDGGYILGGSSYLGGYGSQDYWVVKIDALGNEEWQQSFGGSSVDELYSLQQTTDGGYILGGYSFSGVSGNKTTPNYGSRDYWVIKIDALGNQEWGQSFGGSSLDELHSLHQTTDGGYILGGFSQSGISGTKTSPSYGGRDYWVVKIDALGNQEWDQSFGGSSNNYMYSLQQTTDEGYILGGYSNSGASGNKTSPNYGSDDYWIVKLECAVELDTLPNDISPLSQTACIDGQPMAIIGSDDDALSQDDVTYQWQSSTDNVIWADLNNGFLKDYLPEPTGVTTYYRRIANWNCNRADTSAVHTLTINADMAPTADAGMALLSFCPGGNITLGGSPSASGGTAPYSYQWNPSTFLNDDTLSNPTATITTSGATYTLSVTDANGCLAVDQVQIIEVIADAGPDQIICSGSSVSLIGNTPIITHPSINYDWNLIVGDGFPSSDTTNSQLLVSPTVNSSYELVITGPDGCPSRDTVDVNIISVPIANAGPDTVICEGMMPMLGTAAIGGYEYYWRALDDDNSYLDDNLSAQPIYDGRICPPGGSTSYLLSVIDTANNCTAAYDTLLVEVLKADAGLPDPACAPTFMGEPKPDTDFDYLWTVTAGDFTSITPGTETDSIIYVSPTMDTDYQLAVSYKGVTCTDNQPIVLDCGICVLDSVNIRATGTCENNQFIQDIPIDIGKYVDTTVMNVRWEGDSLHLLNATNIGEVQIIDTVRADLVFDLIISDLYGMDICTLRYNILPGLFTPINFTPTPVSRCADGPGVNIGDVPVAGFTYSWTPTNDLDDPNIANPLATPSETTVYQVEIQDILSGCISSYINTVTVMQNTSIDAGPDMNFCDGAILSFGPLPEEGFAYNWEPGVGLTDSTSATQIDTFFSTVTFVLTATDTASGSNCMATDTIVFTEMASITADAGIGGTYCPIDSGIQLGTTDSTAFGYNYQWLPTEGLDDANSPMPIANPSTSTNYTLIVTDAGGGCDARSSAMVTVTPPGDLGLTALMDENICEGDSVQIGPTTVAGYGYQWSPSDSLTCTDCAQPMAFPSDTTNYVLIVHDTLNCLTDTLSLNINPTPIPPLIDVASETICEGESVQIEVISTAGVTYAWTPTTDLSCTTCADPIASPTTTTTYYLTATSGSCNFQDSITINVNPAPTADAGADQMVCNTAVTIGTAAVGGIAYSWLPSTGLNNAFIAQPDALPEDTTLYILTTTNTTTGCQAMDTVEVAPTFDVSINNTVEVCAGDSRMIGLTSVGGLTYSWSPSTELDNPNIANPTVTPTASRSYTLTVDNGAGCVRTATVQVNVVTPAEVTLTAPNVLCQNVCGQLTATLNSGTLTSFAWSPTAGLTSPMAMSTEICPTTSTTYTFTALDFQGCAISQDILVTVAPIPAPTADAGADTTLCVGESIMLGTTAQNGLTYAWSPVAGLSPNGYVAQPTFSPTTAATSFTLQLTVTDTSTYCTNTDEVTVTFQELSVEAGSDESYCVGDSVTLNPMVTGNVGTLSYAWLPTEGLSCFTCASPKAAPTSTTTYTLTVTDDMTNCMAADIVTVSATGFRNPSADLDDILFCTDNLDVTIDVVPNERYTYNWTLINASGVNLTNGTTANPTINTGTDTDFLVEVTLTDTTQLVCNMVLDTLAFTFQDVPDLTLPDYSLCPGETMVTIGPNPADVSGLYSYQWTPATNLSATNIANPIASPTSDMTYGVAIDYINPTDTLYEGCQITENVRIDVVSNIIIDAGQDHTFCSSDLSAVQIGSPSFYANQPAQYSYIATNVGQFISDSNPSGEATSTITVATNGASISDVNILNLDISHTYISDLSIYLRSPSGTEINLFNESCGSNDDMLINYDDEAASSAHPCPPTDGLTYQANQALSAFDGEPADGIWTLRVVDAYGGDDGSINGWTLEFVDNDGMSAYTWSPNYNLSNSTSANPYLYNPGTDTSYVLTVITLEGCTASDTVNVMVSLPPEITGRDTAICSGQTIDLSTLITGTSSGTLEYGSTLGTYDISNVVSPINTMTYFVRDSVDASCVDTAMVIITVLDTVQTPISQDICQGSSFSFNSQTLTTAGIYRDTLTSTNGCDSFIVLTLNVLDTVQTPITQDICQGSSFSFNSQTLTTAGTYRDTLTSTNGCDSFIVLTLNVLDTVQTPITQDICQGSSFNFNSQNLNTAGTYRDTLTSTNGCDSFIVLTLNVLDTVQTPITQDVCQGNNFNFNSQSLTVAGTYRDTLTRTNGCDSFIVLTLNVLDTVQTPITQDICQGSSFSFNSQTLTTAGTYRDTLTSTNGCDSFIVLTLNVLDTVQTPISQDICQGSSFSFNSQTLTVAGTYRDTLTSTNGCDSFIVLTLNVLDTVQTPITQDICQGSSFSFNSQSLTIAGNYRDTLTSTNGCDSFIVLTLNVLDTVQTPISQDICQGSSFSFNSQSLTVAGAYRDTLIRTNGCDSFIVLTLNVLDTVQTPITQDICQGSSFSFNSQTLTTAGTYRDTMTSTNGCDSFIVLTLNVLDTVQTPITQDICQGSSFSFNSQSLTVAGTYRDTLTSTNGCDSFIVLTLNVLDTVQTPITQDICQGSSFSFNSQSLTVAGAYRDTLTSTNGCDSFIVLTLNVLDTVQTPISQDICQGNSFSFNSQNLTTAGTYRDTLTSTNGCDSFIVLTLNVLDTVQTPITQDICQGSSFSFNSQTLTTAGTYRDTLTSTNGCDSFIVLTLNVLDTVQTPVTQDICQGSSFSFNSQSLTVAGTYRDTLTSTNGCDSFIVLTLNVLDTVQTPITQDICQGSSFSFNSQNLTTAGTYRDTLTRTNGCDSFIVLTLNVNPEPSILGRDTAICSGQSLDLSTMVSGVVQNSLEYGTDFSFGGDSLVNPLISQTYFVRDSNILTACVDTASIQVQIQSCDWGDLPDTSATTNIDDYQTINANNGPVHVIISGLSLGNSVDGEIDGQPSNDALGDGLDENGLEIWPSLDLAPGNNFRLPFSYTNTTPDTAHVEAWIDWNGDGDFDDAGEMVVDTNDGAGTTPLANVLPFSIPTTAATNTLLGLRIRISHQDNMTPYGMQPNGEIEDYLIGIDCPQVCFPVSARTIKK